MPSARALAWTFGASVAVAASIAAAVACLPDLKDLPVPPEGGAEAGNAGDAGDAAKRPPLCGNGIIDLDAGEACDPGEAGAVGCTNECTIDCFDGGGWIDPATDHCYALMPEGGNFMAATRACASVGGHVVSFASEMGEWSDVGSWTLAVGTAPFWVNLLRPPMAEAGTYFQYATVPSPGEPSEPGWAPFGACEGCYAHLRFPATDTSFPKLFAGEAAGECVGAVKDDLTWHSVICGDTLGIVCEREPPGSHAVQVSLPQGGTGWTFQVKATLDQGKHYLYDPIAMPAGSAAAFCRSYVDAAGGELVVFKSAEEREQVMAEILALPMQAPSELWIGLRRFYVDAGADAASVGPWLWEDGVPLGTVPGSVPPIPWGDQEPKAMGVARAYATPTTGNYDSELAHANDNDFGTQRAFVCEYQ